jgi:hypothetical protein
MARTAALEAARAEAPATPVRESAAVGADGWLIAVSPWRELDQALGVKISWRSLNVFHALAADAVPVFPTDHNETTVTNLTAVFPAVMTVATPRLL